MIKRTLAILFSLIIVISTSGCSTYIHAAIGLPITEPGYQSAEVSIAVDLFGVKHIARTECPISGSDPCKLIYTRVKPGLAGLSETVYSWLPIAGQSVHDVDIAVTDSGIAYIVYHYDGRPGATVSSELWAMRSDQLEIPVLVEGTYNVDSKPIVVARWDTVYVVYNAGVYIRYMRLNDGANGWVDHTPGTSFVVHEAAVGWNGALYVIYYHVLELKYADNYGITGDMTNHLLLASYSNEKPDIDVNGNPETVYVIYSQALTGPGASDSLYLDHCIASSCTSMTHETINLDPSLHWKISGNPQVIADRGLDATLGNFAYYIFTAHNAGDLIDEVFEGFYKAGITTPDPFAVTDTPDTEADPHACLMWSYIPVFSWREYLSVSFFGDMYEQDIYPYVYTTQRLVRHTTTGAAEIDMACNADWGAGIWNEETGVGKQAWVSFNSYPAMLPIIMK